MHLRQIWPQRKHYGASDARNTPMYVWQTFESNIESRRKKEKEEHITKKIENNIENIKMISFKNKKK